MAAQVIPVVHTALDALAAVLARCRTVHLVRLANTMWVVAQPQERQERAKRVHPGTRPVFTTAPLVVVAVLG